MSAEKPNDLPPRAEPFREIDGTQIARAHNVLSGIMSMRQGSTALVLMREVNHTPPISDLVAGGAVALFGSMTFLPWWLAVPAGVLAASWRSGEKLLKIIRARKGATHSHPDVPEFQSVWAVECWRFYPLVRGFNLRAAAANRLIREGIQLDAAHLMIQLLTEIRPRIEKIMAKLIECRPYKHDPLPGEHFELKARELVDDTLTKLDLLGFWSGKVELTWLGFEDDDILSSRFVEVLERDMNFMFGGHGDVEDTIDPYAALKRKLGDDIEVDIEEEPVSE